MTGNIYLVGFMGTGKSAVGSVVAQRLNRQFVDMDAVLEEHFRMPISSVFSEYGEAVFRDAETDLLRKLARRKKIVVATGGGVPEKSENRELMKRSGKIVHLAAELESCAARLGATARASRPLWQDEKALRELFARRKKLYAENDLTQRVDGATPDAIAEAIVAGLLGEQRFTARLGEVDCPIAATWQSPRVLGEFARGRRVAVLSDRTVARKHLDRFTGTLGNPHVILLPPGERTKTLNSARRVYEELLENRFDRDALLVALGGGVITDLGAFVASTYKRGMDFILVSTSLVGIVDASVGGKAAVNLGEAKNIVGTFSTPIAVILDLSALRTLGRNHLCEGLVEAYKTGLVHAPELADLIEREASALVAGDQPLLAEVCVRSARTKADVVSGDFRESGLRRILNFGHTFGHAVEGFHRFKVGHGRAVGLGMVVAARLSEARNLIPRGVAERIVSTVRRISPYKVACPPVKEAWEIMLHDKKIRGGRMVFVLLEGVGKPVCVEDVSSDELAAAVARTEEDYHG